MYRAAALLLACALAACSDEPPQGNTPYTPSAGMTAVLVERQAMNAKLPEHISVSEARDVPNLIYCRAGDPKRCRAAGADHRHPAIQPAAIDWG